MKRTLATLLAAPALLVGTAVPAVALQRADEPVDARPHDHRVDDRPTDRARPDVERLRMACEPYRTDAGPAIGCRWSSAEARGAAGYVLYRAVDDGPREKVFRTGLDGPRHFRQLVRPGHRYTYAVVAVTEDGRVTSRSEPVTVAIPGDAPSR